MNNSKNYWKNKKIIKINSCANASLFRFLSNMSFDYKSKNVLEIGFGNGSDLLEFKKRGSLVYGIDINKFAVNQLKKKHNSLILQKLDCTSTDNFFKNIKFDLIYHRDLIYYLSDVEIKNLQKNICDNLKKKGLYVFQYIENDFAKIKYINLQTNLINNFLYNYIKKKFFEKNNPVRFLNFNNLYKITKKVGFKFIGKKLLIESYGFNEASIRINRYMAFFKNE